MEAYLQTVASEQRRDDCRQVMEIMQKITGEPPQMWGPSIIGFGSYHYTYDSGRSGDWPLTGVSPRAAALSIYIMPDLDAWEPLLSQLGDCKTGKCCLYVKKLSELHLPTLKKILRQSVAAVKKKYP
ncbi:hypothetical protein Pla8534_58890 [Lignipirellula cremea]|uniref:YdhG-like domain-containing protein n=1 Tax=Lignipirellula cremea TaxID=2528010 RepID=A0A518E1R0_9BACT|nr:hypothetical protein Pla8534_58890 [Lignipirellula cremea]